LPQDLAIQPVKGTIGAYSSSDDVHGGTNYLLATQTFVELHDECTALILTPGTALANVNQHFSIKVY
jgi:hypothetical protein